MMRVAMLSVLLVGCAAGARFSIDRLPQAAPAEVEAAKAEEVKEAPPTREVKAKKPVAKAPEKAPPVKLPPCESVPGDKRSAILQKLDCVIETGDIPVSPKP